MAENLLDACWECDYERAAQLIAAGCDPTASRDWLGRTPLHLACRDGNLAFVKTLIETHRCDPQHCRAEDGTTPLHEACVEGHLHIVKLLIEGHRCDPQQKDSFGWTPLHKASDAEHPHLAVVRYLVTEQNCDVKFSDPNGLTPLHHACGCFSMANTNEDKALEVVRFLIIECHCRLAQRDESGMDALLHACRSGKTKIARYLISQCLYSTSVCDNVGNTLLHCACQSGNLEMVEFLLTDVKLEPNCLNCVGQPPLEVAEEPRIIRELIRHGADPTKVYKTYGQVLGKHSSRHMQPLEPPIKVFVVGNPSVGKSTVVKALQNENLGLFGGLTGRLTKVTGVDAKTAGIIPYEFVSRKYGPVILYDFAGQREFYASHAAVLQNAIQSSPPIFLLVVDLCKSDEENKEEILYWLSFLETNCTSVDGKAHVIIVGSHADILQSRGGDPRLKLDFVNALLEESAISSIDFAGVVAMNCQYSESAGMTDLRTYLKKSCDALRKTDTMNFVSHCFLVYMVDRFQDSIAVTLTEVYSQIHLETRVEEQKDDLINFVPESLAVLCNLCSELNDRGHLLYLKDSTNIGNSWIILDRTSLLSEVTGTIFAPEHFRQHCKLASSTGVVPRSKLAARFPNHNLDMLVGFLSHLEFCHKISDPEVLKLILIEQTLTETQGTGATMERYFFFPALVTIAMPGEVWEKDPQLCHHFGWICKCSSLKQFLSPQFIQVLILRLAFCFALTKEVHTDIPAFQRKCSVWKNGIYWGNRDGIETLVEIVEQSKAVIVLMRCSEITAELLKLRSSVIQKVLTACKEFCPKVSLNESFLHPHETTRYPIQPSSELTTVSIYEVASAILGAKPAVVTETGKAFPLDVFLLAEPYANLGKTILQQLFEEHSNYSSEVPDQFLSRIADHMSCPEKSLELFKKLFKPNPTLLQERISRAPEGITHQIIRVFQIWRDRCDGSYQSLREELDQYSVFSGRNIMVSCCTCSEMFLFSTCPVVQACQFSLPKLPLRGIYHT